VTSFADEVSRVHDFFNDWYAGRGERSFSEFSHAMHPDFVLVTPSADVIERDDVVEMIRSDRGTDSAVVATEHHVVHHSGDVTVGTYVEITMRGDETLHRVSTAVMQRDSSAPGGWLWLSVHETWIEDSDR